MSSLPIVTVLAATGTQGQAVTKALSASGKYAIRGLTRNSTSEKAQNLAKLPNVTLADATNYDEAFKGASAVYGYSFMGEEEIEHMKKAADAADKAGVDLFIFSSLPSVKDDSNGKYTGVHHFERKQEIEKYLKTLKLKSIILHLSAFVENFLNFGFIQPKGDKLDVVINLANVDTKLPLTNVEDDVSQAVVLILDNYKSTPALFESPIIVTSYTIPYGEHADIIEKVTGKEVNKIVSPTFTNGYDNDLDEMRKYFDDTGIFTNKTIPDPRLVSLGYKPHDFEYFLRNTIIPALGL